MLKSPLYIHYDAGSRGDFLACVLLSEFSSIHTDPTERVATKYPYTKIHHVTDNYQFLDRRAIKIRIALPDDINELLQISFMHHLKNDQYIADHDTNDFTPCEHHYYFIRYIYNTNLVTNQHKSKYTHWVPFTELGNIHYIASLYETVTGKQLTDSEVEIIVNNINTQTRWEDSEDFSMLARLKTLIEFEIKHQVFTVNHIAPFTVSDFVNHCDPTSLLDPVGYTVA